jgi:hypothetical protein
MKKIFSLLVLSIFISGSSCNRILSRALGVRSPRIETEASIQKFCEKKGIDANDVLIVKTVNIIESFYKNLNSDYLFDKNGYALSYSESFNDKNCGGNILKTVQSIPPVSYITRDSSNTFENHKKTWMPLSDTLTSVNVNHVDADYTVVLYWNMFSGSPNHKKRIDEVKEYIKLNTNSEIQLVLVNQDIRPINGEVIVFDKQRK